MRTEAHLHVGNAKQRSKLSLGQKKHGQNITTPDKLLRKYFECRKDIFTACEDTQEPQIEEMSVDEILNGIPGSDYQVRYLGLTELNIYIH